MTTAKEEAKKLLENIPEQATWDDIMYQMYVKKKIDVAEKAAQEGKIISHDEVKKRVLGK
jgi:uncharacterized lipoprotein YehR (DUF1307 family)